MYTAQFKIVTSLVLGSLLAISGCNAPSENAEPVKPELQSSKQKEQPASSVPAEEPKASAKNKTFTSSNGCFEIASDILEKANATEHFTFDITITKACVAMDKIAGVKFDAAMPSHGHGMNSKAIVKKIKTGQYQVEGSSFYMPGHWQATMEIHYQTKVEIVSIDVNL